jgi:glycosyltransferase involved in cell wall biosynthesis
MPVMEQAGRRTVDPSYVIVTAARNEAAFIERTLEAVVAQTVLPLRWMIVSDGSTDATDDIVQRFAREHSWIELLKMPPRRERHFGGKAHAFNAGLARLDGLGHHAVANLDADVSFGPRYFEFLLGKLAEDPALGLVGTAFEDRSLHYDYRFVSIEHVSGPCQLFRRECLEQIGGYASSRCGGVDDIAVVTARMKGWKTRTFPDMTYRHHRDMGTEGRGPLSARFRAGVLDYALGSHPLWEALRTVYQTTKPPYVVGGLAIACGYVWSTLRRMERPVSREFVEFRRREQMRRAAALFTRRRHPWLEGPLSRPASQA